MADQNAVAYRDLAAKDFPEFSPKDVENFIAQFNAFDDNGDGHIDAQELERIMKACEMTVTSSDLANLIAEVDQNKNGTIEFGEFLLIIRKMTSGETSADSGFANVVKKTAKMLVVEGASAGTQHSFSEEERDAFVDHINQCLGGHEKLKEKLPISREGMALFEAVKDGTILCALINDSVPGTIDERVVNWKPKNVHQAIENLNLMVGSCKAIGCSVVNVGHADVAEGKVHIILGLIWQIVRIGLLASITLESCPELSRLLLDGETLEDLMRLTPEQLLLRWFNFHLAAAGHARRVANFSGDIKDSECYAVLLGQIKPDKCNAAGPMAKSDLTERAEAMLGEAEKIGCRKYVTPKDVCRGNSKLNLAFTANLFNTWPALEPLTEEEKGAIDDIFGMEGSRESRTFCLWINSLNLSDTPVTNLFVGLQDGLVILSIMDMLEPGIVPWEKVARPRAGKNLSVFAATGNTNLAVVLGKSPAFRFSLVGIGGIDITKGQHIATLSIVWQLMRHHILSILKSLSTDGKRPTDDEVMSWANSTMAAKGKKSKITSFSDPSLRTSEPFLDLLDALTGRVDYALVNTQASCSEEEAVMNARYVLSLARQMGAVVFLLPEDIGVAQGEKLNPKLIFTLVASLMAAAKAKN